MSDETHCSGDPVYPGGKRERRRGEMITGAE